MEYLSFGFENFLSFVRCSWTVYADWFSGLKSELFWSISSYATEQICLGSLQGYCNCKLTWRDVLISMILIDAMYLQQYSRDIFFFLYFLLVIVAAMTSFTIHHDKSPFSGKSVLYLNRHQTEEWKGWMQVSLPCKIICHPIYSLWCQFSFTDLLLWCRCCLWCITTLLQKKFTMQSVFSLPHMFGWPDLGTSLTITSEKTSVSPGFVRYA